MSIDKYTVPQAYGYFADAWVNRRLPRHPLFFAYGSVFENALQPQEDLNIPDGTVLPYLLGARIKSEPDTSIGGYGAPVSLPMTVVFDWTAPAENT